MEIYHIENLTFTYPLEKAPALRDVNLRLRRGEFVTLCGKSGSGKSTLLRLLKPSVSPSGRLSGTIYFNGAPLSHLDAQSDAQKIGYIGQNPAYQIVTDTVWHELAFGSESLGEPPEIIRARVAETAAYFGISEWFHKSTDTLSGGQEQLLCLASVMVTKPEILLLDEPTAKLDPIAAHRFFQSLSRVCRELGTTVLLSEHRLEEALPLSDRALVMENGKLVCDCPTRELAGELYAQKNEMFAALPTPAKVFTLAEENAEEAAERKAARETEGKTNGCPQTVREGRMWLEKQSCDQTVFSQDAALHVAQPVLQAKNLFFRYDKERQLLNDFSLTLHEGEIYALMGSNGVGKSTVLSVLCGCRKPFHGTLTLKDGKKVALLPQEPTDLFSCKTVKEDLLSVTKPETAAVKSYDQAVRLFGLQNLLERHPYDLSGGEQQKAALAKLFLSGADVLLLDEPTAGLDAPFKQTLTALLKSLAKRGFSILMVSHDIEFCAETADRCGLFFDGGIVSENTARRFFADNRYYTTAAHRMAQALLPEAVTADDILRALHKKEQTVPNAFAPCDDNVRPPQAAENVPQCLENAEPCPKKDSGRTDAVKGHTSCGSNVAPSLLPAFLWLMLAVPLTVLCGVYLFDDRKYLFISLLIMAETALPFVALFEKRKPKGAELVIMAALCAIGIAGRIAFVQIPQFKPVAALVIVTGVCFGGEYGFLVGAMTAFLSNFFFGQGPWTPWQMFAFGLIGLLAGVFFYPPKQKRRKRDNIMLSIFGFMCVFVLYGLLLDTATVLMAEPHPTLSAFLTTFAAGVPFNLIHAFSTAFFLLVFGEAFTEKLVRVKTKYGLNRLE